MVDKLFRRCIETGRVKIYGYPGERDPERMHVSDSAEHFLKKIDSLKEEKEKQKYRDLFNNRFSKYPREKVETAVKEIFKEEIERGLDVKIEEHPEDKKVLVVKFDKNYGKMKREDEEELDRYTGHWIEINTNPYNSRIMISLMNRGRGDLSDKQRKNYEQIVAKLRKDALEKALKEHS